MITLKPYHPDHYPALTAYRLNASQQVFTAMPGEWLDGDRTLDRDKLAITIFAGTEIVGFFILDSGADLRHYSDNPHALLLRSMSIAPAQQGKGYARAALGAARLHPLLRAHFPDGDEIVLGVHHANHAAITFYQRCGFSDSGRTYMGVKGLQYIYTRPVT
ncbi:MAG: GNAT family N-acetyltransferase [Cardiobacterium sp.]|jgi:acetyltransferase, GNAT family|nr:MAG: GNAT family N-acetyltransferase [Cardiobacterium sp.]